MPEPLAAPVDVTTTPAWARLVDRGEPPLLSQLFADDPDRVEHLVHTAGDLRVDLSKQRVDAGIVADLLAVAVAADVEGRRDAMFAGTRINVTEDRPVLHVALRQPADASLILDGRDVVRDVHEVLDRMAAFSERVRSGEWRGHTGSRIRNVVNIGIGGSDLGPVMAYEALRWYSDRKLTFRFV